MSNLRVLIVGASVAGPTAAYWFAKAGAIVTVIERFPHLRANGQAVDIRTAGVTVMRKMTGMEEAVRKHLAPMKGIQVMRSDGRTYGTIRTTGNPDQQALISEYEIFRGDLARILYDMTKDHPNISYIFDEQVTAIQQSEKDNEPVTVEFMNKTPTSEYDLVVACDGATSRTRAIGLGCGLRDYVEPTNCWAAFCTTKSDMIDGSQLGHAYSAVGGRFVALGPDSTDANRIGFMGMYPRGDDKVMEPFREALKQDDDAVKKYIAEHYKDAGWRCNEIIKAMLDSKDFYCGETLQVKLPHPYKGRFALVGDAGYAPGPTGGGTSLALAGAYILAGEISRHDGDLAAGLKAYEEKIKPIVTDLQKIPPLVPGVFAPQTAWGLWLRNWIFAFISWTKMLEVAQKFAGGGSLGNSDKYDIPNYEWKF